MSQIKKPADERVWIEEYEAFLAAPAIKPPPIVSEQILARVQADLNPSAGKLFLKLFIIHSISGTATLLACPQFGISLIPGSMGLMALFMNFGAYVCMAACGALFLGSSGLIAGIFLRPEEIKIAYRTWMAQFAGLIGLSVLIFAMLGAKLTFYHGIEGGIGIPLFWLFGAAMGGFLMLELGVRARTYLATHIPKQ